MSHNIGDIPLELHTDEDFIRYVVKCVPEADAVASFLDYAFVETLDGNMNKVRRVRLGIAGGTACSYIVKHVPQGGYLSKYPSLQFPEERLDYEKRWYEHVETWRLSQGLVILPAVRTPLLYCYERNSRILVLEDFGSLALDKIKLSRHNPKEIFKTVGKFLSLLHSAGQVTESVENPAAEKNREFVFRFHLESPEAVQELWRAQLSPGADSSERAADKKRLEHRIREQEKYISKYSKHVGPCLSSLSDNFRSGPNVFTHGDLHTGSLLILADGSIGIIDAELSDFGPRAFDVGTLSAHVLAQMVASGDSLTKSKRTVGYLVHAYTEHNQPELTDVIQREIAGFAGAELLRRLIGPAGFNTPLCSEMWSVLLAIATDLILDPGILSEWLENL